MSTSALQEFAVIAMGEIDECRMSLFAIHHLLKQRSYGPAQLIPALNDMEQMAKRHADTVMRFTTMMAAQPAGSGIPEPWLSANITLLEEAAAVLGGIGRTFSGHQRLGARVRLDLEAKLLDYGGRCECLHDTVGGMMAAATGQTRFCELTDVMTSGGRSIADYAPERMRMWLIDRADPVEIVPEAWRLLIQQQLWWFHDRGQDEIALVREVDDQIQVLSRSACNAATLGKETLEQVSVPLRRRMAYEPVIADIVASALGISVERHADRVILRRDAAAVPSSVPGSVLPGSVLPSPVLPSPVLPSPVLPGSVSPGSGAPGSGSPNSVAPSSDDPGGRVPRLRGAG